MLNKAWSWLNFIELCNKCKIISKNDFYNNIFQFEKITDILKLKKPIKYLFDPEDFLEYTHTMTHQEGSALENHDKFASCEFRI